MKKYLRFGSIAVAVMLAGYCAAVPVEGLVTAAKLNARIFPELKSPAVTKLYKGQKLMIFKRHGAWLEIAAPGSTPVYAAAAYVRNNRVLRDISLRTQPAVSGPEIKRVRKGTILKAVSEPDRYGWVQVAPTEDMRLYVVQDYVKYDKANVPVAEKGEMPAGPEAVPAPVKKEAPKAAAAPAPVKKEAPKAVAAPAPVKKEAPKAVVAPAPVKKEAPKAVAAPAPVKKEAPKAVVAPAPVKKEAPKAAPAPVQAKKFALSDEDKRELLNIGVDIKAPVPYAQKGILVAVDKPSGNCTRYALADAKDGSNKGFLFADPAVKLEEMINKTVAVKGFAYRNEKWKNPVVGVSEITVAGE